MKTDDVIEHIENQNVTAVELLDEFDPNLQFKFAKAMTALKQIIDDVRILCPDASYYIQDDAFYLMLGDSHSGDHKQNANTNLIALTDNHKLAGCISGGGF